MTDLINISWLKQNSLKSYDIGKSEKIYSNGNEIFFTCGINCDNMQTLLNEFHKVLKECLKKENMLNTNNIVPIIWLFIDSPGGTVKDCFKFIDFIKIMKKNYTFELYTVCCGLTASAATLMAVIGDKRYVSSLSLIMIHELFGSSIGTYTQLTSAMKSLEIYHNSIINIYLEYNKKMNEDDLINLLKNETWFSAKEYIDAGFADEIIGL